MTKLPPKIDPRTATQITEQVQDLLVQYTPGWQEFEIDPVTQKRKPKGISAALIGVFGRFTEIIIQRLNQVPNKNFLAFLDLLGASRLPPQPARVPLTFSLTAGSAVDAIVPIGTQVAAPPAEGEKDPVIFETERELVVTAAQLQSVFVRDPEQDQYGDYSVLAKLSEGGAASAVQLPAFRGDRTIEHLFYLGDSLLLSFEQIKNLSLTFTLDQVLGDGGELAWQFWNGTKWETFALPKNRINNLSPEGTAPPYIATIDLGKIAPIPLSTVNAYNSRWLRGQLTLPITRSLDSLSGMVRNNQLPVIQQVQIQVSVERLVEEGLLPDLGFINSVPIEINKPFYPFGEKPQFNDTLYLASTEAFSKDRMFSPDNIQSLASTGASITLGITLANPWTIPSLNSVRPDYDLQLTWECWNGSTWQEIATSEPPNWLHLLELEPLPPVVAASPDGNLIPVLIQGTAKKGATLTLNHQKARGEETNLPALVGEDSRFAAEVVLSEGLNIITCTASYREPKASESRQSSAWIIIFQQTSQIRQTLQLSVNTPTPPIQQNQITLQFNVTGENADAIQRVRVTNGNPRISPTVSGRDSATISLVEGRNEFLIEGLGTDNSLLAATTLTLIREVPRPALNNGFKDETYGLRQSGNITLRLPDRIASTVINGQENYWLRVRIKKGDYGKEASYKLLNPLNPAAGFTLVLATFRPPIIEQIKIGYEQTLTGLPEFCLTDNNLEFIDVIAKNKAENQSFPPFYPAPDEQPTLYLGLTLPPNRELFSNRPLSLFCRTADFYYGEKLVPISPTQTQELGMPGSNILHQFWLTNPSLFPVQFQLSVLGNRWIPSPTLIPPITPQDGEPELITLKAGESRQVEVRVSIPLNAPTGSSDKAFLKLTQITPVDEPPLEYSATLETFVGTEIPAGNRLQVNWQYWNGQEWVGLTVRDDSENFTRQGLVEFLPPADFASKQEFGLAPRYWLRAIWKQGRYAIAPRLKRLLLNTTMAAQTVTLSNEVLGSSDGTENQRFRTTRAPVLKGQQLEVRELEMPSAEEQQMIARDEGNSAITPVDSSGRTKDVWVRWHEVPDFYGSSSRDRHYVIDHLTGEIQFGNGLNGLIPPIGKGNVRLGRYQTGGGARGNKPAGAIVQLKTTVPYVEKVTNTEAAAGGADAENLDALRDRIPKTIRHRNRAVTIEDYEDLALLASPEVVRAKCVPLRNLSADPLSEKPIQPGEVSVIIVPKSTEIKPLPSQELISRVQDYLQTYSPPTVNVSVAGPLYLQVNITAEIALTSLEGASAVEQAVEQKLASFLHPLTGGLDGTGWDFGREPHRSDFFALIESVPGVDHIRSLMMDDQSDSVVQLAVPVIKQTGLFLVYSGKHTINLVFEPS